MALVSNQEEERHVSENVLIGKHNPKKSKPQGTALEEWDAADDANVDNT